MGGAVAVAAAQLEAGIAGQISGKTFLTPVLWIRIHWGP